MDNTDAPDSLGGHDDDLRDADVSFSVGLCSWYHEPVRHSFLSVFIRTHHLSMTQKAHPTISVKAKSRKYVGTKPHATGLRSTWILHMSSVKWHRWVVMARISARRSIHATCRRDMSTKKNPVSPFDDRISGWEWMSDAHRLHDSSLHAGNLCGLVSDAVPRFV